MDWKKGATVRSSFCAVSGNLAKTLAEASVIAPPIPLMV